MAHYFHRFTFSAPNCAAVRRRLLVLFRMLRFFLASKQRAYLCPYLLFVEGRGSLFWVGQHAPSKARFTPRPFTPRFPHIEAHIYPCFVTNFVGAVV